MSSDHAVEENQDSLPPSIEITAANDTDADVVTTTATPTPTTAITSSPDSNVDMNDTLQQGELYGDDVNQEEAAEEEIGEEEEEEEDDDELDLEAQEKPTEPSSSAGQEQTMATTAATEADYPNALIQFHKIINDKIQVTAISNFKENLYIGTANGDIYHLIKIESEFILISKTSLYELTEEQLQPPHSIRNIVVLDRLQKILIHSNETLTFLDIQLQRLKNKQLHNVQDISLCKQTNDLTFFQTHIIRNFDASTLKLLKKIDFGHIRKGVKFENFAMVLNGDEDEELSYDLVDFNTFSKIPILTLSKRCQNPIIKVLEQCRIFFMTLHDDAGLSMGVLVDLNGDIMNSVSFDKEPIDVCITKDQFIMVSFEDSVCCYCPLHDEIKLVERTERPELERLRFAHIENAWSWKLGYSTSEGDEHKTIDIQQDVVLYNDDFVEIYKLDVFKKLAELGDINLINAQMSRTGPILENSVDATQDIVLEFWKQLKSLLVLEKFTITDDVSQDFLFYLVGAEENLPLLFDLLEDRIQTLKQNLSNNTLFTINLRNYLAALLQTQKSKTPLPIKLLFLDHFKQDYQTIHRNIQHLASSQPQASNSQIIEWFQQNKQHQLLLTFYKVTNQLSDLKDLYKEIISTPELQTQDPNFNKYDPQLLPLFQDDLETLQKINRLNLINSHNFQTDELLQFVQKLEVENEEQDVFFWSVCKRISVMQNQELNLKRLQKALLKSELKKLR